MYADYVANKTNLIQYVRKNLCFCVCLPKNWTKCSLFLELFFLFLVLATLLGNQHIDVDKNVFKC
jgi:hypothetical protein